MSENYDLGTARARIAFTADERNLRHAAQAFRNFERTLEGFKHNVERLERSVNRLEGELSGLSEEFSATNREVSRTANSITVFSRNSNRSGSIVRALNTDLSVLIQRLRVAHQAYSRFGGPLLLGSKFLRDLRRNEDSVFGLGRAFRTSGLAAAGFSLALNGVISRITDMKKARLEIRGWQAGFLKLTGPILATVGTLRLFNKVSNGALVNMANRVQWAAPLLQRLSKSWRDNTTGLRQMALGSENVAKGLSKAIVQAAIFKVAISSIVKPFKILKNLDTEWLIAGFAGVALLSPALELVGKTLTWFSNIALGALDAVKQLSGGLLLLPGLFASLLTVMGTVAVAAFGIKDAFKAAFEATDEDFEKALEKLPTKSLKDVARAVRGVKDEWMALQTSIGERVFQGFAQDIKDITATYIPVLSKGMLNVGGAINQAKNELIGFATSQKAVDDVGKSFQLTGEIVRNLNKTIRPVSGAFLDIIVVGQEALADLSIHADRVAKSFAKWASVNRENGNMRRWIDDAVSGVIDLWRAIKNASQALWTILTAFADRSGENALERLANSMVKFNEAVSKSAASGFLKKFADGVRNLGVDKLQQLNDILFKTQGFSWNPFSPAFGPQASLKQFLQELIPAVRDFSSAFSSQFVPTLKTAMGILKEFFNIIDALGLDSIIGWVLGFAAAWKVVDKAWRPIIKLAVVFFSAFKAIRGVTQAVQGFASIFLGALNNIGKHRAANVINKIFTGLGKIAKVGGGAAAAIFLFTEAIDSANNLIDSQKDRLNEYSNTLTEWRQSLTNAFTDSRGLVNNNVLTELETGISNFRNKLEDDARQSVSWFDRITSRLLSLGGTTDLFVEGGIRKEVSLKDRLLGVDAQYIKDIDNLKREGEAARQALEKLGLSNQELAGILGGSEAEFEKFIQTIDELDGESNAAANGFRELRKEAQEVQNRLKEAGPGAAQVIEGLKQLASAGDDATQKLNGLKNVLQGLGYLQQDPAEAAFRHAQAVRELANAANELVDAEQPLGDAAIFKDGTLNFNSVNAENLYNALKNAADSLQAIKVNGGDVVAEYKAITDTFPALAEAFQLGTDGVAKIQQLFNSPMFLPDIDTFSKIPVDLDPDLANASLDELISRATGLKNLVGDVPVLPVPPPGKDPVSQILRGEKPESIPLPIKPETDSGAKDITDLFIPGGKPVEVPVAPKPAAPAAQPEIPLPAVNTNASNLPEVAEQAQQVKQQVEATVDALAAKIQEMANIWNSATNSVTEQTKLIADTLKQSVTDAGNSGMALAKSFAAGISSQTAFVAQAAMGLAQAASAPLPQSPAKIGPFSGRGYTIWRGRKLSEDFAAGIAAGGSAVAGATLGMVGGSSTTLNEGIEKFIKDLTDLSGFGKSILSIIDSISQIVFDTINLVTTDWATGESKLGKVFKKTVSDEELAIKRADRFQASIGNAADFSADFARFTKNLDADDLKNLPRGGAAGSEAGLQPAALFTRRLISNLFPQIQEIGGVRADAMQWHPSGRGLDIIIPGGDTRGGRNPQGKRIGDQIAALANANKEALGLNHVLWQTMQGGNHFDHVHLGFNEGARVDIENIKGLSSSIGALIKEAEATAPGDATVEATKELKESIDENNDLTASDLEDRTNKETLDAIIDLGRTMNATPDEISGAIAAAVSGTSEDIDRAPLEMAREFLGNISQISRDLPINERAVRAFPGEVPSGFLSDLVDSSRLLNDQMATNNQHLGNIDGNTLANMKSSEDLLNDYLADNPQLDNLIEQTKKGGANDETNLKAVYALEDAIRNTPTDTAQNRALREQLGSIQSSIMEEGGITETPNAVDQAQQIAQGAVGIAGDVFRIIDQSIKSIEAAHDISNTLVRGIENTKDISETVDNVQEFIKLGADIAQAVSSVSGTIGSIVSAASSSDPSGGASGAATAIQGVSQIAGIVSAALNTVNGVIDLVQEGSRIAGKYVGRFLTSISGLSGVSGDIKYLLDTNTGILKAYSSENPLDKQERRGYNMFPNQNPQAPRINYLTVYGGPGQDPRDTMNDAMWAINTTGAGVFSDV